MIKCYYCEAEVTQTLTKPYEAYTVMIAHQNTHIIKILSQMETYLDMIEQRQKRLEERLP